MQELTIAIVAYNAEETIERAVKSAMAAGPHPILLVDDGSVDATISVAKAVASEQITVCRQPQNKGVGAARARALQEITTPYGMWLDADDEILPDRPEAMIAALEAGADIVYDGGVLVDEKTGEPIKLLDIPDFMHTPQAELRCFERNWYPLLHCGFRVAAARTVGLDGTFECAEDYDFLLRSIEKQLVIAPLSSHGYRYYHALNSISRNLTQTRKHVKRALDKHSIKRVEGLLGNSALSGEEKLCLLAGMSLYRQDFDAAYAYAQQVDGRTAYVAPYLMQAGCYADFVSASALLGNGKWQQAHDILLKMVTDTPSADVWNNLGVTLHKLGNHVAAQNAFKEALLLLPGYHDAQRNIEADEPSCWTTHPMRRQSSRDDYSG